MFLFFSFGTSVECQYISLVQDLSGSLATSAKRLEFLQQFAADFRTIKPFPKLARRPPIIWVRCQAFEQEFSRFLPRNLTFELKLDLLVTLDKVSDRLQVVLNGAVPR